MPVRTGFIHGTGAALNIEIGFVPDYVRIWNVTNGDVITGGFPKRVIIFSGGGTQVITKGNWIKGITSGAKARITEVILDSGSWAGGDAAGWFLVDAEEVTGVIASENAQQYASEPGTTAAVDDDVTIQLDVEFNLDLTLNTLQGQSTLANQVIAYIGTEAVRRKGFTMGASLSENGILLFYLAIANDPGMQQDALVLGNNQETVW